jgi:hypothetical protein
VGGVAFFGFDFGIECLHVENAFDRAAQDALQLRRRDGFRLENIIAVPLYKLAMPRAGFLGLQDRRVTRSTRRLNAWRRHHRTRRPPAVSNRMGKTISKRRFAMGHHYVPRKYLRGWCEPKNDKMLWQYDKERNDFDYVSLKSAANEKDYYPPDVEQKLADLIEAPGNVAIGKLRLGQSIDDSDAMALAVYMGTMLKRVPRHRKMAHDIAPTALTEVIETTREAFDQAGRDGLITPELKASRMEELRAVEEKFRKELPPNMIAIMYSPWPSQEVVQLIRLMAWRFLTTKGPSFFITTDNPVFLFHDFGLRHDEAELVFPISKELALHGCWQLFSPGEPWIREMPQKFVKEFNRRMATVVDRFVYYHKEEWWIRELACNPKAYLSRIRW